jgi:glycosyltransferase involved in cell wall biosynthesis
LRDLSDILSFYTAPIYWWLHDYFTICPSYNLFDKRNQYCGFPNAECKNCSFYSDEYIASYYNIFLMVQSRLTIVAPSEITKEIWGARYHNFINNIKVVPHWDIINDEEEKGYSNEKIRIAFLGTMQENKGARAWEKLIQSIDRNRFELFHFGKTYDKKKTGGQFVQNILVSQGEMISVLKRNTIDIAFLWSTWPETYSYTYFEAYAAGCYVLTNTVSGNISAMVAQKKNGKVLDNIEECISWLNSNSFLQEYYLFSRNRKLIQFKKSTYVTKTLFDPVSINKLCIRRNQLKIIDKISAYIYYFLRLIYCRKIISAKRTKRKLKNYENSI